MTNDDTHAAPPADFADMSWPVTVLSATGSYDVNIENETELVEHYRSIAQHLTNEHIAAYPSQVKRLNNSFQGWLYAPSPADHGFIWWNAVDNRLTTYQSFNELCDGIRTYLQSVTITNFRGLSAWDVVGAVLGIAHLASQDVSFMEGVAPPECW